MIRKSMILVFIGAVAACAGSGSMQNDLDAKEAEHTIFFGGDIITMEGDEPTTVEAVVEHQGEIVFVGSKAEAFKEFGENAEEHDLEGATMMPGFIEPHAHPVSIGAFLLAHDIVAPHEWRMPHKTYPAVRGKEQYLAAVQQIIDEKTDKNETVQDRPGCNTGHSDRRCGLQGRFQDEC